MSDQRATLPLDMQRAAVLAARRNAKTLEQIEAEWPDLKDGVKAVRDEEAAAEPPPRRRGSGSVRTAPVLRRRR